MTALSGPLRYTPLLDALSNTGEMIQFGWSIVRNIVTLRVFRFSGEILRQAGILIVSSTVVVVSMIFFVGLQCGIEGGYNTAAVGAPAYAAVFTAWCDLRELVPYVFGYMLSAKVGTGIVAELGSMRISEEIDALEVMGVDSLNVLCSTKMLAAWLVLPFLYLTGVASGFLGSWVAVVHQLGQVSSGGYLQIFWQFQNPPDLLFSLIKATVMTTVIVLVACYYGYNTSGGPVGVGTATAKSMAVNIVLVHLIGLLGTEIFWGGNPRAPIGG
jgi:phospholipid/cholesterol/gamma-HCH transport system permease protein